MPPSDPKYRVPNPFIVFIKENQNKIAKEFKIESNQEKFRKCGEVWKSMTEQEKAPFKKESERLQIEHKKAYPNLPDKKKKINGKTCNNTHENQEDSVGNPEPKITRPPNSFRLFMNANRERIETERGTKSGTFAACGQLWESMSAEEKAPYEAESKKQWMEHREAHPGYKFPSKKKGRKSEKKKSDKKEQHEIEGQQDLDKNMYKEDAGTFQIDGEAGKSNLMYGFGQQQLQMNSKTLNQYNPNPYQDFQNPTGQSSSSAPLNNSPYASWDFTTRSSENRWIVAAAISSFRTPELQFPLTTPTTNYNQNQFQHLTQFFEDVEQETTCSASMESMTSSTGSSGYHWSPETAVSSAQNPLTQLPSITPATNYNQNHFQHSTNFVGFVAPDPSRLASMESAAPSLGPSEYQWNPESTALSSRTPFLQSPPLAPATDYNPNLFQDSTNVFDRVALDPTKSASKQLAASSSGSFEHPWTSESTDLSSTTPFIQSPPMPPGTYYNQILFQNTTMRSGGDYTPEAASDTISDESLIQSTEPFNANEGQIEELEKILHNYQP